MSGRWLQTPHADDRASADEEAGGNRPAGTVSLGQALLTAIMATILFVALLVAVYGVISLATGLDLISDPDISPLVGPVMAAFACVVVFVSVLQSLRPRGGSLRLPWARSITTAIALYLLGPLLGALLVTIDQADFFAGLLFFVHVATGPFIPASAVIAIPMVLFAPLLAASSNRPR